MVGSRANGSTLTLLPAVDVADGQAVRLVQGAAGSETSYGDPLAAALAWQDAGAEWIHLVDLDAAFGRGSNRELLATVVGKLDVAVELSGGIRDDESLEAALATGCARVNLGTAALETPDWCATVLARYEERIAVGLDVRGSTLAARGWTQDGGDLWRPSNAWIATAVRGTSSPTSPGTELFPGLICHSFARCAHELNVRSLQAAASRPSRTSRRCPASCRTGLKGPLSARRSMPRRSPWKLPSTPFAACRRSSWESQFG